MSTISAVLLMLHLAIAASLVGVVLLQRSEGGGLGMGSNAGSFMTGRGTANFLTRVTAVLAGIFFVTSISLSLLARQSARTVSPLDAPAITQPATPAGAPATPAPAGTEKAAPAAPAKAATPEGGVLKGLEQGKQQLPKSQ